MYDIHRISALYVKSTSNDLRKERLYFLGKIERCTRLPATNLAFRFYFRAILTGTFSYMEQLVDSTRFNIK